MLQETVDALRRLEEGALARDLESQRLDFKEATDLKATMKIVADAAVCFANADGGEIVVGVRDAGRGTDAYVGLPDSLNGENLQRGVFDRTRPQLTCVVEEIERVGRRVLVVSVPRGIATYSNSAGTATRRLGTDCMPFTPEQQRETLIARGYIDFSREASAAEFADLDLVEFDRLRRLLTLASKEELAALDDHRLLEALQLATSTGEITNAGLVLLGRPASLSRLLPSFGYSYQFRPTPGSEAIARVRGNRSLLAAIDQLMETIETRQEIRPLNLAGGVQLQLTDYPSRAVRELVVNGFIHRSYEVDGSVDIEHSPGSLTVSSPGGLVSGVTPANILTYPSTPRNRLLTETVAMLQVAERTGQGVDRAYREMLRTGKEPPRFEDFGSLVRATLDGGTGDGHFARFVSSLPTELAGDVDALLAFTWLRNKRGIDARQLAETIQRSSGDAESVLRKLSAGGFVEPTVRSARSPHPTYRLRPETIAAMSRAVAYGHLDQSGRDQKVVDHVQEYGFVTNKTIQRLFDTNVYNARNILSDLRRRGIVEKVGDARGGVGVTYGPGPSYPA